MTTQTNVDGASIQSIVHASIREKPILFSAPMVRAILNGKKTQTRRMVKVQPPDHAIEVFDWRAPHIAESAKASEGCYYNDMDGLHFHCKCPYGTIGDRLWVRESFTVCADCNIFYKADGKPDPWDGVKWKPSIHMPRRASRINLEIEAIRVERLNEISEADAKAEGIATSSNGVYFMDYTHGIANACKPEFSFMTLWKSINGPDSWDRNPWVWVVQFRRV